jgi:ribulose-5-phosphate 4-epimerase/fuculose-1-phosphate aldolase
VGGSLSVAAQLGNIDASYEYLIRRDAKVLEKIDDIPFVETPVHTAVYAGHTPAVWHGDHELKALLC